MSTMQRAFKMVTAIKNIEQMIEPVITPETAAEALGCKPHSIRIQANVDPSRLGFPVCRMGATTLIPRVPFLQWLTGQKKENGK